MSAEIIMAGIAEDALSEQQPQDDAAESFEQQPTDPDSYG